MPFNVTEFRSNFKGDGARPTLFEVQITLPRNLQALNIGNRFSEKLSLTCRAADLPGAVVGQVPVHYFGREVKLAGNRIFQEWTVSVLNDEDFVTRSVFEQWGQAINSHETNLRNPALLNPNEYVTDGIVHQMSKTGDIIYTYVMKNMFPTDISPIQMDWSAVDQIEEFQVTFAYDEWLSQGPNGSGVTF